MNVVAQIGHHTLKQWRDTRYLAAVLSGLFVEAFRRRTWTRVVRDELRRQIMNAGLGAIRFVAYIAVAIGISIVAQTLIWMDKLGKEELLGPLLVIIFVRETGPLLINLLVISRTGTTLTAELGRMQIAGEVRVLDAQGLDPFIYLVLPRVTGFILSVLLLNLIFILVAFTSGYLFGTAMGANTGDPLAFFHAVLSAVTPVDLINLLAKTLLPALLAGIIFCTEGLGVKHSVTEITGVTQRALSRSVIALFMISAIVTLMTYL